MRLFLFLLMCTAVLSCRTETNPQTFTEDQAHLSPKDRFGQLFIEAQMAGIFDDGKTTVDCIPKYPTEQIMAAYAEAKDQPDFDIKAFFLEHFARPPQPATGFTSDPGRPVSEHISVLWDVLTRQPDEERPGTLISLPNPYIVPGGRFREIYYWDSYFTMLGLQADGRVDMIENMVGNFAYLIDSIGFIPNGNRTYFLTRSQPPFFSLMVGVLAEEQGDEIYTQYLPQLQKEYDFWMDGAMKVSRQNRFQQHVVRMPDGKLLNRYYDRGDWPREEMWKDDVEVMEASGRSGNNLYPDLRAACESGWDFSSRWFADQQTLMTAQTTSIVPVDLNALLYRLEQTLAQAYALAGDQDNADLYTQRAADRERAIQEWLWDDERGFYRDFQLVEEQFTPVLSLAGVYPLFVGIASEEQAARVAQVLRETFLYPGGLVSTPNETGQQWDAPNGWAPLQYMAIAGLRGSGQPALADTIRNRWVALNTNVYRRTGKLVEKYNVMDTTLESGGGEYPVQDGFGWTNGVLQALLKENTN